MKEKPTWLKLVLALVGVAALFFAAYILGEMEDRDSKYKHPITQPGARW